eukprot:g2637.t1
MTANFDHITSASNPLIKVLRSLDRKKGRNETGLFLAEGARLIEQAMSQGWQVETLVVSNAGAERAYVSELAARAQKQGARLIQVPDRLAGTIARKDNPQAVIAAIRQRDLQLTDLPQDDPGLWIGLYECRDPGNLGTILRTADCAGAAGVIMIETCCDPYSVEAVRASMGSLFDVRLARASFEAFDAWRKAAGLNMVAASVNARLCVMDMTSTLFLADQWADDQYALLDSGDGCKLERFGAQTVIRPDPQAFWPPASPIDTWTADAKFDAKAGDDDRGNWQLLNHKAPEAWPMTWRGLHLNARRTPFRHIGLFQEHSVHWAFAQDRIRGAGRKVKLLNLFGYTGMMSLAAAQAGAEVTHLDASPKSNGFGKEHAQMSGLEDAPIRWIADDAMKFTAREIRRGNTYDAIVLDPPKFGRGTKNETWRFEEDLPGLLANSIILFREQSGQVVISLFGLHFSTPSRHVFGGKLFAEGGDAAVHMGLHGAKRKSRCVCGLTMAEA